MMDSEGGNVMTASFPMTDQLSESGVRFWLKNTGLRLHVVQSISSTNTVLRQMAEEGEEEGSVLLANSQTAGRGRMDRRFYSPPGTGLYLSLLLRPRMPAADAVRITACAAVAAAEAIEETFGIRTAIKWVNDILIDGKKVCGILTEGSVDPRTGLLRYAIVGIGINITPPRGGFPPELSAIAGAVCEQDEPGLRCRLAALLLDRLTERCNRLPETDCYETYRRRSCIPGREILILSPDTEPVPAAALDILPDFSLLVRLQDGTEKALNTGEVSIRTAGNISEPVITDTP